MVGDADWLSIPSVLIYYFFPGNLDWNGNGKTTYGDMRW